MSEHAAPLILGGGPAGAAAAIGLARIGVIATVLERRDVPDDALCGGFLSWATLARIAALGIDPATLGGHAVTRLAIFAGRGMHEAPLPALAIGLSRRRLDTLLLDRAQQLGADVRRGITVQSGEPGRVTLSNGETWTAETLFLATGKHDLRGMARPRAEGDPELGLRMRLPASPTLERLIGDHIELHLFDRGYLGLVLQEDGSANACMAVRKSRLAEAGGDPLALFAQLAHDSAPLADRLSGMSAATTVDAIGNVPYGWRATGTQPGLFRLGDQAAVIPSLAGEGMGIALASAAYAVAHWQDGGANGALRYQQDFARTVARPMRAADSIKALSRYPRLFAALATLPSAAQMAAKLTRLR